MSGTICAVNLDTVCSSHGGSGRAMAVDLRIVRDDVEDFDSTLEGEDYCNLARGLSHEDEER